MFPDIIAIVQGLELAAQVLEAATPVLQKAVPVLEGALPAGNVKDLLDKGGAFVTKLAPFQAAWADFEKALEAHTASAAPAAS